MLLGIQTAQVTVLQVDSKMMKVDNKVEPITTIDTESKPSPPPQKESQINQENGILFLYYFSWIFDIFLSVVSTGLWIIIPTHNMLEKPSYW